ncbi:MAG: hypothetical protein ACT4OZ_06170 [Gemmatimonadota bacterium]
MPRRILQALILCGSAATGLDGQRSPAPRDEQIAAAVLPLPEGARASARVLGYVTAGKLQVIREGSGMVCLAHDPAAEQFHVACYHEAMEPFMARGRELRSQGVTGTQVDTVRFREAKGGQLKIPEGPTALYSLTGGSFDPKAGTVTGARHLYVVYIPYATGASTGLPERPLGSQPWIMFPGTPKAHIMFTPTMR